MGYAILNKNKRGQATLESYLVIIVVIALLAGITKIWVWSNNKIVHRQLRYNASRKEAGTATDSYELKWPLVWNDDAANEDDRHRPPELGRDEAFREGE